MLHKKDNDIIQINHIIGIDTYIIINMINILNNLKYTIHENSFFTNLFDNHFKFVIDFLDNELLDNELS